MTRANLTEVRRPARAAEKVTRPLDLSAPYEAARELVKQRFMWKEHRTLVHWQSEFWEWTGSHFDVLPTADLCAMIYALAASLPPPKRRSVDDVIHALRAAVNLSNSLQPPFWLSPQAAGPDPHELVAFQNGLLHVSTVTLLRPTPQLFSTSGLQFDYDANAPRPNRWLQFLRELWDDDESIALLQEFAGYLLTSDTRQQKALLIVGPKRSGKGTVGRMLVKLLGASNVCSPTIASLGAPFGLQSLIGKRLGLISDARLTGRADVAQFIENVLRITGEDLISIPRKFKDDFTATLTTRLVVLTNELPAFTDSSGAIGSRFLVLSVTKSFLGREDLALGTELEAELPGIMNWALAGLKRLHNRGHFVQPKSAGDLVDALGELTSPVSAFVAERCVIDVDGGVSTTRLYEAWRTWCAGDGREPGTQITFGRNLRAACPTVRKVQVRDGKERDRKYTGIQLRKDSD